MSSSTLINGDNGQLTDWSQVNWRKVRKHVRNLRQRIFRARKLGQWKQLGRLQKLLIKSRSNLLRVRQITQVNTGKQTAGIDKEIINTPAQRVKLVKEWVMPKAKPAKRVYIPKSNGKKRPLGIPTIKDRVAQAIVKNALEPEWEAVFEANSYGFRPGTSCHDAIQQCFTKLSRSCTGGHEWVLDADIKGFFDNIAHETIINKIGSFPYEELIIWERTGFIDKGQYTGTETGTPQGGVISPLLANIGLQGLEKHIKQINPRLGLIRYADDFILTSKEKKSLEDALIQSKQWLIKRGLEISLEKTRIVNIDHGLDFLGFNIRQYQGKLIIKPQKDKVVAFCNNIGQNLSKMEAYTQEQVINGLNPLLRGFANYYRGVVSKETFSYINYRVWQYLWPWAKRRHPKKNKFKRYRGVEWTFMCQENGKKGKVKTHVLYNISSTPIVRHIKGVHLS